MYIRAGHAKLAIPGVLVHKEGWFAVKSNQLLCIVCMYVLYVQNNVGHTKSDEKKKRKKKEKELRDTSLNKRVLYGKTDQLFQQHKV